MSLTATARRRRDKFRSCGKKHGYKSMLRAEKALREYIKDFPDHAEGMNAYECRFCLKFHIGKTLGIGRSVNAELKEPWRKGLRLGP